MAEYNNYYLALQKRLTILKLASQDNIGLTRDQMNEKLAVIDNLLKLLDERYSDGLYLESIEDALIALENEDKK